MASNDNGRDSDVPDPVPTPPGVSTKPVGPFGLPVPVPDMAGTTNRDEPQPTETDPDQSPKTDVPEDPQPQPEEPAAEEKPSSIQEAAEYGGRYLDRVEQAIEEEQCDLCKQILSQLRGLPLDEQVQGVRELAQLKEEAGEGADPAELAEVMDQFEVIDDPNRFL